MSCSNCNNNNCGCHTTPCVPATCGCPIYLSSDCINDVKSVFSCLEIESNLSLTETLEQIDAQVCAIFNNITNYFALVNTGTGAEVYNGVNNLGQKKIRKINKVGNLVTVTQNTDDISISIDETALDNFIEANQLTTVASQLDPSVGKNIYKNTTTVGDVSTLNFRSLIHSPQGGVGESIVRDIQENANDLTLRTKKLNSSTLTILSNVGDTEINIDIPSSASIPALYVNNLYVPTQAEFLAGNTKGLGTLAKPFTDTITAYVAGVPTITPNTAIQNALDSYVGTGTGTDGYTTATASRRFPQKFGQKIIIQDNQGVHVHPSTGDFNYTGLNLIIQGNVLSQKTGFLVDLDNATFFNQTNSYFSITVEEKGLLQIEGEGFNNSGNSDNDASPYTTNKTIVLNGNGTIYSAYNGVDVLNRYIINSGVSIPANFNDSNTAFTVYCNLRADYQGVYKVAGNSKADFYGKLISGLLTIPANINVKPFLQTGGQVRMFGSQIIFSTSTPASRRTAVFYFEPSGGYTTIFISTGATYGGVAQVLFKKVGTPSVSLEVTNSPSGYGLDIVEVFDSPNLWNVKFTENVLASGNIDSTKADLTQGNSISATNTIGSNLIETLRTFTSKNNARLSLIPKYGAYLVQRDVNAGNLIIGTEYKIKTAGTGTPLGTVGDYFIATNNGSAAIGGVATLIQRETMI
jgi:hypothetical protein